MGEEGKRQRYMYTQQGPSAQPRQYMTQGKLEAKHGVYTELALATKKAQTCGGEPAAAGCCCSEVLWVGFTADQHSET